MKRSGTAGATASVRANVFVSSLVNALVNVLVNVSAGSALAVAAIATAHAATPAETRLMRVADHIEIEQLLMEYGRTLDDRNFEAYSQLFAKTGIWSGGFGTFKGPAEIKAAMEKSFAGSGMQNIGSNFHLLTNPIIEVSGETGTAWSKWTFVRMVDGKPTIAMSGIYTDKLVREDGKWKFQNRVVTVPPPGSAPAIPTGPAK
jgi:hypothetical protein